MRWLFSRTLELVDDLADKHGLLWLKHWTERVPESWCDQCD
jgi:hypothetical protein